jgi:hypothetical protein
MDEIQTGTSARQARLPRRPRARHPVRRDIMVTDRFDASIRALIRAPSRRDLLRGLAGAGFGLTARLPVVEAKRKRRHRHRKKEPKPNALGCLDEGTTCKLTEAHACCSGVCEKKGDAGKCGPLPPAAFGCTNSAKTDFCAVPDSGNCPDHGGFCIVDENDRPLCIGNAACAVCTMDADCDAIFAASARCIQSCAKCDAESGGSICVLLVS